MKIKLMLWAMFALLVSCGAAWAQEAGSTTAAMPLGVPEMLLNLITSWLLPVVVIPFILQHHWPQTTKRIVSGVVCFGVALLATVLNQEYSFRLIAGGGFGEQLANFGSWFLLNATVILAATQTLFTNFWRDTGLPDKLEKATSPKPTKVQEINKKVDKVQTLLNAIDALSYLKNTRPDAVPGAASEVLPASQAAAPHAAAPHATASGTTAPHATSFQVIAGAPVAADTDFSDVDATGVVFDDEEPPVPDIQPLLGTIDFGAVRPSKHSTQEVNADA
jgi:hypothetical protein